MTTKIEVELFFLRSLTFASSTPIVFRGSAFSPFTTQHKNVFTLSEDSSNFAANCSLAKTFTKKMSRKRLTFLRPSEKPHHASASVDKNRKIIMEKWSYFKKVRVREIAKKSIKGAEVETE